MKTFVIGDIHGQLDKLLSAIEKSGIDKGKDRLICLGDVCDRGPKTVECIRELKSFKNLVYVLGNHDAWTLKWLCNPRWAEGRDYFHWCDQGGVQTIESITAHNAKDEIREFLEDAPLYYEYNHKLFVHAGIHPDKRAEDCNSNILVWDRDLVSTARLESISNEPTCKEYDYVFVGHTPTIFYNSETPLRYNNVWMMDTGACYGGKLSIMNIDTEEFWQSA